MTRHRRPIVHVLLIVAVATATLSARAAVTVTARRDLFGMVTHYWGDVMPVRMQELGAGWVRVNCTWATVQPAPDPDPATWDWSCPDQDMSAAAQGLRVLYGLGAAPAWANGGQAENFAPAPEHLSDWYHYCVELMRRYQGRGIVYEVWNEPNIDLFFQGSYSQYIDLVRLASQAARATDATARLSGPEASSLPTPGRESWYRDAVRDLGGMLDIVTTHWYCGTHCGTVGQIAAEVTAYMNDRASSVPVGVPLWLTETGSSTPDDGRQAEFYEGVLQAYANNFRQHFRSTPAWQNVFFYHLLADDDNTIVRTDPDRTNRAAFYTYQKWIHQPSAAAR